MIFGWAWKSSLSTRDSYSHWNYQGLSRRLLRWGTATSYLPKQSLDWAKPELGLRIDDEERFSYPNVFIPTNITKDKFPPSICRCITKIKCCSYQSFQLLLFQSILLSHLKRLKNTTNNVKISSALQQIISLYYPTPRSDAEPRMHNILLFIPIQICLLNACCWYTNLAHGLTSLSPFPHL